MSDPTITPELKNYKGNCHCGAFKFTAKLPELGTVSQCNCSICSKKGYRWIPAVPSEFIITRGEGTLKEYTFGPGTLKHQFCGTCGTAVLGKKEGSLPGINANALDLPTAGILDAKVYKFDGKASDPQYIPAKFAGTEPAAEIENSKTYYGSCHCGDITVAMKIGGDIVEHAPGVILECDCSICVKDATILTYPLKTALSVHASFPAALTTYTFGRALNEHKFCSNCGVYIYIHKKENVDEVHWKKHKGDASQEEWRLQQPVNLRIFDGVDWDILKEKGLIQRGDWSQKEPKYVVPE